MADAYTVHKYKALVNDRFNLPVGIAGHAILSHCKRGQKTREKTIKKVFFKQDAKIIKITKLCLFSGIITVLIY